VPFPDRGPRRTWRERKVILGAAAVLLPALAAITVEVWIAKPKGH
jgi:ubiquinol-cytochrome c reductase cytochrome b subunit